MTPAIIFIHRSNSNYLSYTLTQAKLSNAGARVILLGDTSNRYELIEHFLISDYFDSAHMFAQVYKHLSTNPIDYELFCFQRWFILKDLMQKHGIPCCLYLDSDVMLYADVIEEQKRLSDYDIALAGNVPSSTYINSINSLENFCQFVLHLYSDPATFQSIESIFKQNLQNSLTTSISDMFAFQLYRNQHPEKVGELLEITHGSTYETGMTVSDGFQMLNGAKKIDMIEGYPYGYLFDSNESVQFKALHFQGASKHLIKDFFVGNELLNHIQTHVIPVSQTDQSIELDCVSSLDIQADSAQLNYDLGSAYLAQGNLDKAIKCFRTVISLLPDFLGAYINLGVALIQKNQPRDAIQIYHQALQIDAGCALAYGNMGYAYAELGDYRSSELCTAMCNALEVLNLRPDWAEAHRNLGLVHQRFGNIAASIDCFRKAIELRPDFTEAHRDLQAALECSREVSNSEKQDSRVNIIFFPDWQQLEALYSKLKAIFRVTLLHPNHANITLFIDTSTLAPTAQVDVEEVFNEILFELLMVEEISLNQAPEIYPINTQDPESQQLLSQAQVQVIASTEDIMRLN